MAGRWQRRQMRLAQRLLRLLSGRLSSGSPPQMGCQSSEMRRQQQSSRGVSQGSSTTTRQSRPTSHRRVTTSQPSRQKWQARALSRARKNEPLQLWMNSRWSQRQALQMSSRQGQRQQCPRVRRRSQTPLVQSVMSMRRWPRQPRSQRRGLCPSRSIRGPGSSGKTCRRQQPRSLGPSSRWGQGMGRPQQGCPPADWPTGAPVSPGAAARLRSAPRHPLPPPMCAPARLPMPQALPSGDVRGEPAQPEDRVQPDVPTAQL